MDERPADPGDRPDPAGPPVPAFPPRPPLPPRPPVQEEPSKATVLRRRAVGLATGIPHAVGLTLLLLFERYENLSPSHLAEERPVFFIPISELTEYGWFLFANDLAVSLTFGKEEAFLWASVLIALLVRLNRAGPAKPQFVLSVAAAVYCSLISLAFVYYLLQPSWWILLVLGAAAGAVVRLATRR
ncbi:hypothetical protein GCM10010387_26210 [Streptomyces inusitatus]|uniref:Uncharacterized protein n=1 Tax=Streptomyces inusitatus TaxID=68221 RepID=A0A918Q4V7_9ACTN|nr:hypothetical protein [Streptomyces inusitatus]GGZ31176.1 hypothetical protein GCM10010387_26210 [Streptomyces inusitatus]